MASDLRHLSGQLLLHLGIPFLNARLLLHECLLSFPLLPLQSQGSSLLFKLRPLLLRGLLQTHQSLVVLLAQQHFLLLDLLVQHQVISMLLLVRCGMEVVRFLLVRGTENVNALPQLLLKRPCMHLLLRADCIRRWQAGRQARHLRG